MPIRTHTWTEQSRAHAARKLARLGRLTRPVRVVNKDRMVIMDTRRWRRDGFVEKMREKRKGFEGFVWMWKKLGPESLERRRKERGKRRVRVVIARR